jgi:hypothetical protein
MCFSSGILVTDRQDLLAVQRRITAVGVRDMAELDRAGCNRRRIARPDDVPV